MTSTPFEPVRPARGVHFSEETQLLVVGAGACGLTAALTASDAGLECVVLERDDSPSGSTSLSSGLIPAAGTRAQADAGIEDSPARMAADIQGKAHGQAPHHLVEAVTVAAGPALDWLGAEHGIELTVVTDFLYPGHSVARMHGPPSRTGAALLGGLLAAGNRAGIPLLGGARVRTLFADADRTVRGVEVERPDGALERIGCRHLLLACNGYGGNPDRVRRHIPEMADAQYFGHPGNQGEALDFGEALGARLECLSAYQGHGSVASPHQILITWALMMEGGIQVNANGERFSNEHDGYSEQAVRVLAQPGGIAWNIHDERLHAMALQFEDYREAERQGAIVSAPDIDSLADRIGCAPDALAASVALTSSSVRTPDGRDFGATPGLVPPYRAVRVSGALFHTQGGLAVDGNARVVDADGNPLPNLYAGGGAACGVSGTAVWGYLSGNGLLTAVTLGRLAALDVSARRRD